MGAELRFPETLTVDGERYRKSDLCTSEHELNETLDKLDRHDIEHHIDEHKNVDTTDWPGRSNEIQTVYVVYAREVQQRKDSLGRWNS